MVFERLECPDAGQPLSGCGYGRMDKNQLTHGLTAAFNLGEKDQRIGKEQA